MNNNKPKKFGRRDLLKTATAGAGALAASAFLPKKWVKPLVDIGVSPAHAQASFLTGTISGVVTINSNTPVQGSVVTVRDFPALTATSAQDGSYTITNVPVGTYTVDCLPPTGQSTYSPSQLSQTSVVVTSGATTTVNFNFGYLPGTITGFVTANTPPQANAAVSSGTPVAGAVITLRGFPTLTATSAQDGSYTITNIPVGSYVVDCEPPTGQPQYSPSLLTIPSAVVNSNSTTTVNFEFILLTGTIAGFVSVFTEVALPGAVITVREQPTWTATSGEDGTYTIPNVTIGTYTVDCVPPSGQTPYDPSLLTQSNVVVIFNDISIANFNFDIILG